jgi:nucleotide-binding universal stress UspA family protein
MKETANLPKTQTETSAQPTAPAQFLFSRILAPTDFSHKSEIAVDYAVELARPMHAQLTLLHVFPERSAFDSAMREFPHGEWDQAKEEAQRKLAEEITRAKLTFREIDSLFRTGLDFRDEILSAAKEVSADLLVLSTHGYIGWKQLLFGSDAEKILERASCPILVVGLKVAKPEISAK